MNPEVISLVGKSWSSGSESVVPRRTVCGDIGWRFDNLSGSHHHRALMIITSAQVVETSVNVTTNSPFQEYTHPDDYTLPKYDIKLYNELALFNGVSSNWSFVNVVFCHRLLLQLSEFNTQCRWIGFSSCPDLSAPWRHNWAPCRYSQ